MQNILFAIWGFGKIMADDTHLAWRRFMDTLYPSQPMFINDHLWEYDL